MDQTLFLLLGALGLVGIGALVSDNDDAHPPEEPEDPFGGREVIIGDADGGPIDGTDGDDAILPYDPDQANNDLVDGQGGNDLIWTGEGNDTVVANPGDDQVYLGADDDLYGAYNPGVDEGHDTIIGGSGDDTIITNGGEHSIYGDGNPDDEDDRDDDVTGKDSIYDNGGTVYVDAGRGDDLIWSPDDSDPDAPDTLLGGDGNDTIFAGAHDLIDAGKGSDTLILSSDANGPADVLYGGSDNLQIALPEGYDGDREVEMVQDGDDVILSIDGNQVAILRDIKVSDVRPVTFLTPDQLPQAPWQQ